MPSEQRVGDGGTLRCHLGHAMSVAQMGDECERPVARRHRIDVPVRFGVRRDDDAHLRSAFGSADATLSDATQPTARRAAPATPGIASGVVDRSSVVSRPVRGGAVLTQAGHAVCSSVNIAVRRW